MRVTIDQIIELMATTVGTQQDAIGCDDCFSLLDQFAQAELDGTGVPASLEAIRTHLDQCQCCRDEYVALLEAIRKAY